MVSLSARLTARQGLILVDLLAFSGKMASTRLPTHPTLNRQAFVFVLVWGGCGRGASALPPHAERSAALSVPLGTLRFEVLRLMHNGNADYYRLSIGYLYLTIGLRPKVIVVFLNVLSWSAPK